MFPPSRSTLVTVVFNRICTPACAAFSARMSIITRQVPNFCGAFTMCQVYLLPGPWLSTAMNSTPIPSSQSIVPADLSR